MTTRTVRPFTGRHATYILVAFFGIVAAVNFTMARYATSTFGGVVVKNSYVASQDFNEWLDQAEAQRALGWRVEHMWAADGHLTVTLGNVPDGAAVTAMARHPLGREPDRQLAFASESGSTQSYVSHEALPAGRWILRLQVTADGRVWRSEEHIR